MDRQHPSRIEIADLVGHAFADGPRGPLELAEAASERGARPEIVETLAGLPDRRYRELRDLWAHLGHLPVGA